MAKVLTSRFVESVKPNGKRTEYPDAGLPGFALRVSPDGSRSFTYRYRSPVDRRQKRKTWGWPSYTLADARKEAEALLRAVGRGEEPVKGGLPETVGQLCDRYVTEYLKKQVRRWKAAEGEIENHIRPRIGSVRREKLSKAHIRQLVGDIEKEFPVAANRVLARARAMFNWGIENDLWELDPTKGIKKPTKERPVSRVLSDDELVKVWNGTEKLGTPAKEFFRFAILSGQRRDDIRCLPKTEVDVTLKNWVIPAERYKSTRSHLVPLTEWMLEQFGDGEFLFSTDGKKPYGNLVKPKRTLDKASGVAAWTIHDIRRTVRTGLARLGVRPDVAERVIGHSVGGKLGETYDVYSYRDEKLKALELWQRHLASLLKLRIAA